MAEKEFDQLTPEEKKARFQKAFDDYNSGFVEVDYALRSVASIRVEEALEDAGRGLEEFKPAQRRVLFEAAKADLNMEHYMNPKFSASHMKFIMEQEMVGRDVTWLPIGKILHRSIVDKPLTRDQIRRIKERMQRAEPKESVIADLHEKKKEAVRVPKKQGQQKRKESGSMARKSRYLGYMKGLQKISKHERTSTKESLLDKLRSMKNREFTMNIPVREGVEDEH